jgi:hypothetical protein
LRGVVRVADVSDDSLADDVVDVLGVEALEVDA